MWWDASGLPQLRMDLAEQLLGWHGSSGGDSDTDSDSTTEGEGRTRSPKPSPSPSPSVSPASSPSPLCAATSNCSKALEKLTFHSCKDCLLEEPLLSPVHAQLEAEGSENLEREKEKGEGVDAQSHHPGWWQMRGCQVSGGDPCLDEAHDSNSTEHFVHSRDGGEGEEEEKCATSTPEAQHSHDHSPLRHHGAGARVSCPEENAVVLHRPAPSKRRRRLLKLPKQPRPRREEQSSIPLSRAAPDSEWGAQGMPQTSERMQGQAQESKGERFDASQAQAACVDSDSGSAAGLPPTTSLEDDLGRNGNKASHELSAPGSVPLAAIPSKQQKLASFLLRARSAMWMVGGFVLLAYLGHVFMWGLVVALQVMMAHEVFVLAWQNLKPEEREAFSRPLNWHFVVTAMVYMYGWMLRQQLLATATSAALSSYPCLSAVIIGFVRNHLLISYSLYLAGFVAFVLSLEGRLYRAQFGQLAWTHLAIFLIILQSSYFAANIFQGLVWFLLPCSLVIVNDCAAYVFGVTFGRTPLIRLSPKKTWEGFLGAAGTTLVAAFLLAGFIGQVEWLVCPRKDLLLGPLHCIPSPTFQPQPHSVPVLFQQVLPARAHIIWISPFQMHAVALAAFASTVAPFGGFFASGFKRAYSIKDFGETIPGHGGVTDRMDCQVLMALFSYVYFQTCVGNSAGAVDSLASEVAGLPRGQLLELHSRIASLLA